MSNELRPSEVAGLIAFQRARATTEGYGDGFTAPFDPSAIAARSRELAAESERLLASMRK